ncbi:MAG: transposase, partial [Planctomycetota bacterium]
ASGWDPTTMPSTMLGCSVPAPAYGLSTPISTPISPRRSRSEPIAVDAFHLQGIALADLMPLETSNDSTLTVTGVLRRYARPFQADWSIPWYKRRVLDNLLSCRDGSYGSHSYDCSDCGSSRMIYTQCNDRHCPGCGWLKRKDWIARVQSWELDCSYFHTVFTIPHELSDLFLAHPTTCYNLLFRTVQRTLCEISREAFGCQPGVIMTLHTWGQEMRTHIHIHAIVSAGGIPCTPRKPKPRRRKQSTELSTTRPSANQPSPAAPSDAAPSDAALDTQPEPVAERSQAWIPITGDAVAFEPRQLADRFRDLLVAELLKHYRKGLLDVSDVPNKRHLHSEEEVQAWLGILRARRWIADSQITPKHLVGRDSATRYVACYVTGTAISNSRIRADDGRSVTIDVWDYRTDRWTTETMPGEEFVRRFLLHIIPPYVHRVRYAGCFHSGKRKGRLAGMRAAILEQNRQQGIPSPRAEHKAKLLALGIEETDEDKAERLQRTPTCLTCGKPGMRSGQHRNPLETRRYLDALKSMIAYFAWSAATTDRWNSFDWQMFLARIHSPKASFWDWSLRQSFERSHCEFQIGVTLGNDANLAAACSQSTIRTASLPLPDI